MPLVVGIFVVTTVVIPVAPASIVSSAVSEGVVGKEMRFHPGDKDISIVVPSGDWVDGVPSHFRHNAGIGVGVAVADTCCCVGIDTEEVVVIDAVVVVGALITEHGSR